LITGGFVSTSHSSDSTFPYQGIDKQPDTSLLTVHFMLYSHSYEATFINRRKLSGPDLYQARRDLLALLQDDLDNHQRLKEFELAALHWSEHIRPTCEEVPMPEGIQGEKSLSEEEPPRTLVRERVLLTYHLKSLQAECHLIKGVIFKPLMASYLPALVTLDEP
jgi:hypothetical protein